MTDFTMRCIEECKRIVKDTLGVDIDFIENIGKRESYCTTTLDVSNHKVDIYVYDDEAGFMADEKDWTICETQDYSSDEKLIESFIAELEKYITANK